MICAPTFEPRSQELWEAANQDIEDRSSIAALKLKFWR